MAKKRTLEDDPPSVSSEEEQEDASSEEDSEDEQKPFATPSAAAKKSKSEAKVSVPEPESKKSRKKQSPDNGGAADDDDADGGTEKKLFQRVWSEEDEVVILEGMIDYAEKHGKYPVGDMEDFHDSLQKSIQAEGFSKTQLNDKVRRLKKKYRNNAARAKYNPSKTHDQKVFLLSKKIWGEDGSGGGSGSAPSKPPKKVSAVRGRAPVDSTTLKEVLRGLPEDVVERGLQLLSEETKADLLAKWNKIFVAESELSSKRNRLLSEHAACVLEALKK